MTMFCRIDQHKYENMREIFLSLNLLGLISYPYVIMASMSVAPLRWQHPSAFHQAERKKGQSLKLFEMAITFVLGALAIQGILKGDYYPAFRFAFAPLLLLFKRRVPTYELNEAGISYQDGYRHTTHSWNEIEWYSVLPVKIAPSLKQIVFKTQKRRFKSIPPFFVFDPHEIDEQRIIFILQQRLPDQDLKEYTKRKFGSQQNLGPWC